MIYDVMIIQYDNHNEELALIINKLKPKKLVIILESKKDNIDIYKEVFNKYKVEKYYISNDFKLLENIIKKYLKFNTIILLNGGKRLVALQMLDIAARYNTDSVYMDVVSQKRYVFGKNKRTINKQLEDLYIDYIAKLSGIEIVKVANDICEDEEIILLTKYIMNNLSMWQQYKNKLYDNKIFIHDSKDFNHIKVNKKELNDNEIKLLDKIINYLNDRNIINYKSNQSEYIVTFLNQYIKRFIFKSGTWLEIITYLTIKDIDLIDEVKCSVEFLWNESNSKIRNELDVVAVKNSILICVSCKDSNKYDEDALNELEVYSKVMGGNNVIKILVATRYPIKESVKQRAKEMNIHLVILENSISNFKENLVRVISSI